MLHGHKHAKHDTWQHTTNLKCTQNISIMPDMCLTRDSFMIEDFMLLSE